MRYEAILSPQAIDVLDNVLHDDERREALRLIEQIRLDPSPNNTTRIILMVPPAVFTVLVQSGLWIVYHIAGSRITIVNIGHDTTPPAYR